MLSKGPPAPLAQRIVTCRGPRWRPWLWAAIGMCPLAASRRCPLTAISSRWVLAAGTRQPCPCRPRPARLGRGEAVPAASSGTSVRGALPGVIARFPLTAVTGIKRYGMQETPLTDRCRTVSGRRASGALDGNDGRPLPRSGPSHLKSRWATHFTDDSVVRLTMCPAVKPSTLTAR